jgi:MscS family membrane protein
MTIAGNELWRIAAFSLTLLFAFVAGRIIKYSLNKSSGKVTASGKEMLGVTFRALGRSATLIGLTMGLYFGIEWLKLDKSLEIFISDVIQIIVVVAISTLLFFLVEVPSHWLMKKAAQTESKLDDMLVPIVRKSLRLAIIILAMVQSAQILSDKPITSILAGLGIGGLALALAAQDTLKNFFGSIVIFVDKPFQVGDRVMIDGFDGPVEEVGLRSTKIRTLDGYLVTVPNGELANKTISNIGKRPYIKRVANITITYDTPPEMVYRALEIIK